MKDNIFTKDSFSLFKEYFSSILIKYVLPFCVMWFFSKFITMFIYVFIFLITVFFNCKHHEIEEHFFSAKSVSLLIQ